MNNLQVNQSFSVDDIRRIREEDDKRRCHMTPAELAADIRTATKEGHRIMAEIRVQKAKQADRVQ